jgi:2-polyprenyl-6-methoxyphenol hydroxylase-like FAD-dependent oxidoreductase
MSKGNFRAAVMGGSIGGLTAALVLRSKGWTVDVFERSSALLETRGAGIISHPITLRFLTEFGGYSLDDISNKPRLQFENSWMVGQEIPFGLYKPGDSAFQS